MVTSLTLFKIIFISKRPRVASFAVIIKIATKFFKSNFRDSKELRS